MIAAGMVGSGRWKQVLHRACPHPALQPNCFLQPRTGRRFI